MTIAIVSHPECLLHEAGISHPERHERVEVIQDALLRYHFAAPVAFYDAPYATREQLENTHAKEYVDFVFSMAPTDGVIVLDPDTWMNPFTLNAALRAAGAVVFAVDLVMKDEAQVVFCNVRPPGHHAEFDKAMGFCFFNNVAVGVKYALEAYRLSRIAIIDFDVHHGNGTQNIFQNDERVLYCSSFEYPFYPGYHAELDNEHLLGVPLSAGAKSDEFREKVAAAWFDKIAAFKPELIFFSAGFDAHKKDPLANLNLDEADYVWITQQIAKIAKECCKGKIISALEGGYDLAALAHCVPAHVNAMVL